MAKQDIEITTADGTAHAGLFRAPNGATAGVILYMDAFGPRPALDGMAERLAALGYVVLVPDLFYREALTGHSKPKPLSQTRRVPRGCAR